MAGLENVHQAFSPGFSRQVSHPGNEPLRFGISDWCRFLIQDITFISIHVRMQNNADLSQLKPNEQLSGHLMDILKQQTRELREVDLGQHVQRIHVSQLGGPLQFSSQFVMRNKPCIIEGAFEKWPALHKWNAEYITQKAGAAVVTVDITPHGRGDAVTSIDLTELQEEQQRGVKENVGLQLKQQREKKENTELGAQGSMQCFITPCERKMLVGQFFHLLRASRSMSGIVPYVQVREH
eukprot:1157638-Pelagomonas_calceolata.AAC.5